MDCVEPKPKSCAHGTAGLVMAIGLSINGRSHLENQFDDWSRYSGFSDFNGIT